MADVKTAIMDAAERRMRVGGFGGFSSRTIAADVGVKSSSVHYHFPTKENLAAAVVQRYTKMISYQIDRGLETDPNPVQAWTNAFRNALHSDDRMCPCIVLGAASRDLPPEVAMEVRKFFEMCLDKLTTRGFSLNSTNEILSTLMGAMVIATALGNVDAYDRATLGLKDRRDSAAAQE
jgi:TetR/AcrR family transcriptional regulator, transcriptional repressor for nem operon